MTGPAAATLAVLALCWPAWWAAGLVVEAAGLGEMDLLLRVSLMFVALGLMERVAGVIHGYVS